MRSDGRVPGAGSHFDGGVLFSKGMHGLSLLFPGSDPPHPRVEQAFLASAECSVDLRPEQKHAADMAIV